MNKDKLFLIAAVFVASFILFVNLYFLSVPSAPQSYEGAINEDRARYFVTELVKIAGQPIEGFEPRMLMNALPGLQSLDFQGVRLYRSQSGYSSRDGTITMEGFSVLLVNISRRLGLPMRNNADIDVIFKQLRD